MSNREVNLFSKKGNCTLCGKESKTHRHCRRCHIGIGRNHIETRTKNGLCSWCQKVTK